MLIVLSTKTHNENECCKDEEWEKKSSSSCAKRKKALHKDNIILTFEKYLLSNENIFRS